MDNETVVHGLGSGPDVEIRRLRISLKELSRQLGVPDALIRAYQKHGFTHEMKPGEIAADLGFCSDELAAFSILSHCHSTRGMPLPGMDFALLKLVETQGNTFFPQDVFLTVWGEHSGCAALISAGTTVTERLGPKGEAPTHFDVTALRKLFDAMLEEDCLKFPRAQECVLSPVDPRIRTTTES